MSRQQLAKRFGFSTVTGISIAPRGSNARPGGLRVTGLKFGKLTT